MLSVRDVALPEERLALFFAAQQSAERLRSLAGEVDGRLNAALAAPLWDQERCNALRTLCGALDMAAELKEGRDGR